jgi:hypothetical protein
MDKMKFDLDELGINIADCYASNKKRPAGLHGKAITTTAEQSVRNVFLRQSWYLGTTNGIPHMTDPKRRYQDYRMLDYWNTRDGQENHEEVYQGSSACMMQQVEDLRYSMRKLWLSISYKRIAATWAKYGALNETHHGFVPNRGTDSGFLDLLNQLEKAHEWGVSALLYSSDVKQAFNSVSRTVIRMALNRLGVPANMINMVHAMEVEGITIVRIPLT